MAVSRKKIGKCDRCNRKVRDTDTLRGGLWNYDGKWYDYYCYQIVVGIFPSTSKDKPAEAGKESQMKMSTYDVMAGGCAGCVAADKEIEALESRLAAADALAVALKYVEFDNGYCRWCEGEDGVHLPTCQRQKALRQYEETK